MKTQRVTSITQKAQAMCSGKKWDVVLENCWWEWKWKYIHSLGTVEIKRINRKCGGNEGSMLVNDLEWLIFCELCGMKRECVSLISDFDFIFVSITDFLLWNSIKSNNLRLWVLNLKEATWSWRKTLLHRTRFFFNQNNDWSYFKTKKNWKPRRLACGWRAYLLTPASAHNSSGYQVTWKIRCCFLQAHP